MCRTGSCPDRHPWPDSWRIRHVSAASQHHLHPPSDLRLFLSRSHDCGYLPQRQAATLFIDPEYPMTPGLYDLMLEQGFRRSGSHVYRPYCHLCEQCIPARIPTA
ncbi:MAG: hypothetical protein HQL53_05750, partial [Magnetococcales bacterium]|nr:hypothetical protein [Magnetococcales bacterium]